jgi:hypothetical protein
MPGLGGAGLSSVGDMSVPHDLGCTESPQAAAWASAKSNFRTLFGEAGPDPFDVSDHQALVKTHQTVMGDLTARGILGGQADDCGEGRLFLTMLSVFSADQPAALLQALYSVEQLTSPILTLLLDIPWIATAQSGWPFFGLLAQLNQNIQKVEDMVNTPEMDSLDKPAAQKYFQALAAAMPSKNFEAMHEASVVYTDKPDDASAISFLTAMAGQAMVLPLNERIQVLQSMQQVFKQVVGGRDALVMMLGTRWPVWSFLHAAITPITTAA